MATYSPPPGLRLDYARDGTVVGQFFVQDSGTVGAQPSTTVVSEYSQSQKDLLNKEAISGGISLGAGRSVDTYIVFLFPEKRFLAGVYVNRSSLDSGLPGIRVESSTNSTNGVDGTWDVLGTIATSGQWVGGTTDDAYRTSILGLSQGGVTALRLLSSSSINSATIQRIHVYGVPDASVGKLRVWHPTLNQEIGGSYFDWGDTPLGSSADLPFRLCNTSTSLTASSVSVQFSASGSDPSPSTIYQHFVSDDGLAFRGILTIPSIGPGLITQTLYVRRVTPTNAFQTYPVVTKLSLSGTWT